MKIHPAIATILCTAILLSQSWIIVEIINLKTEVALLTYRMDQLNVRPQ